MISIIIPIYNESFAVEKVITDIARIMDATDFAYEIIAVDDKSTDDSLAKIKHIPRIRILTHNHNKGVGASRNTGLLASKGEIIIMIDADGTYPVNIIPELIKGIDDCDMIIGKRKQEVIRPIYLRWLIKCTLNKIVSLVLNKEIKDINSGLRIFKKQAIMPFLDFMPKGHSWVSTSTIIFTKKNYRIKYLEIDYFPRIGCSSFHLLFDGMRSLHCIIRAILLIKTEKSTL